MLLGKISEPKRGVMRFRNHHKDGQENCLRFFLHLIVKV
jgi:hypothetical protein